MHRLLTKKHRDDEQPKTTNKLRSFKRNKSQPPPASRPQVDLTQALPPTDDFRISLMMPNLEKRFSVLRDGEKPEQGHGPGINGMGYGALASGTLFNDEKDVELARPPHTGAGLADITEVASIRSGSRAEGSIDWTERPNPAEDLGGNMMNRPRHGEGNVLFGGRQKIFRINTAVTGSSEDLGESPLSPIGRGRMGGRALYTDDLPSASALAKAADKAPGRSQSPPPLNYNLDRNTQSSTNSGPSSLTRSSTTATSTSTNSRNFTTNNTSNQFNSATSSKPRKLIYEQALDRDVGERELNVLENQKLAIMAQKRAGSTSPHPYSEEDEKKRTVSPAVRSFARPFSPPQNEPETRGRSRSPVPGLRGSSQSDSRSKTVGISRIAASTNPNQPSNVPFSFGFEQKDGASQSAFPGLNTAVNSYGLPTPRPESDEYQVANAQLPAPTAANGSTPSPSPLTEHYSGDASAPSRYDHDMVGDAHGRASMSRRSSISNIDRAAVGQQTTFFEASDSELDIDDGASSVYEDDPYIPFEETSAHEVFPDYQHQTKIPTFPPQKQNFGQMSSPVSVTHDATPLQGTDSPTLPPNAGLSTMIRQHLRSDSGISSIYTPSMHIKVSEPYQEPPSLAQALAGWDNQDTEYDEEAPFQSDGALDHNEAKSKFSLGELKKGDLEDKKFQQEKQSGLLKSAPMERNPSENTMSTLDDETDEWRTQLEEKKKMLQQRLQEHSGRNSPAPGYPDGNDEPQKNSILKPGMLGNMLKGKGSPSTPSPSGRDDPKAMKVLGISPMLNQSKDSFGRRDDEEDNTQERPEEKMRQTPHRPDMHLPHDTRSRGPSSIPGQRVPPNSPPYGPNQRSLQNNHPNQSLPNGPRSFLPMMSPPPNGQRKGAGHVPIEAGMPSSSNMHREFVEQGRGAPRSGAPHSQHRGPHGGHGHEHGNHEFRPPHDRPNDARGLPQQPGRSRARSNAQRPKDMSHRSPPHAKASVRRGPSEEDLRGRQRGAPTRVPGVNDVSGVMTTVTAGPPPSRPSLEKKSQGVPRTKNSESMQQKETVAEKRSAPAVNEAKALAPSTQDRRPANLTIPMGDIPQSKFSPEDSPQGFVGRFRSNSKSQKLSSPAMFEQEAQPAMPPPPKAALTPISNLANTSIAAASGSPAQTLAELTGSDGTTNPALQAIGPTTAPREGKKMRIRKTDISEPRLLHTTSQMPVSKLIDAGGTNYHNILPPGLSDPAQLRQRSGSDESVSRAARGPGIPPSNQRTSDPDGERTRVLRKAASDGSALRDRAASNARHPHSRPAIPSPAPFFGTDGRPINAPQFFNNAPAGMI